MTEAAARAALYARSGGVCELTGARAAEASHRQARSQLGGWRPANLLHLSSAAHAWLHAHPVQAREGGWHVPSGQDPGAVAVWLELPWPGWWRLDDHPGDGGGHLMVPVDAGAAPVGLGALLAAIYVS